VSTTEATDDTGAAGERAARSDLSTPLLLAAAASAAAGLVHAAAAGTHNGDRTLTTLFAVTAAVQLGWAALAVFRPVRRVAILGAALGVIAVGAWALSRTVGLPAIGSLAETEPVGLQDGMAALLGGLAAVFSIVAAAGIGLPRTIRRVPAGALGAVALIALAVPGVAADHAHGPSHDHDGGHGHGEEVAAAHHDDPVHGDAAHDPAHGDHVVDEPHGDHAGGYGHHDGEPIVSLTDERVSDEEREAAQKLIDDTVAGMARFTTVESVQEAGYVSIGDGVTGWEHFVHIGHMSDGVDMDPNAIESVVFKVYPDGTRQLASAMYILGFGATMDDVPDIAGELTTWHDHQDLCWEGVRVVGTTDDAGNCRRGSFRGTAPMLHVWMIPHRCGPFAGIEGSHGSGCSHDHGDDDPDDAGSREETAAGS
jgi:hypothetical protein